eukprot:gb/GECG01013345.1/.p1 GENE.gb/GECG01013345.1/~~gb/GECG01013345.1/.p1  ORF type:complete len:812 (+),score=145.72 gb/GECG01013345.1/:1-2436(+)
MGGTKKKQQNASLGRALVRKKRDDNKKKAQAAKETGFHVADVATSSNKLKSITEMSSVEDFMANAVLADRQFKSNQDHVELVDEHKQNRNVVEQAEDPVKRHLSLPRKPTWDTTMSKEDIIRQENDAFLVWRSEIAEMEQNNPDVAVTPFEKNVEVWRQLWRVVEKSDVVVQVVDARNPLLFRCPDLENYVKEVDPNKQNFLIVNKADFLSPMERVQWAKYFRDNDIEFVFFSAKEENDKLEERLKRMEATLEGDSTHFEETDPESGQKINSELARLCAKDPELLDRCYLLGTESLVTLLQNKFYDFYSLQNPEEAEEAIYQRRDNANAEGETCDELDPHDPQTALGGSAEGREVTEEEQETYESQIGAGAEAATFAGLSSFTGGAKGRRKGGARGGTGKRTKESGAVEGAGIELNEEHVRWVNGVPVVDTSLAAKAVQAASEGQDPNAAISQSKAEEAEENKRKSSKSTTKDSDNKKVTIGFVGYPNVGKSSVINLLLGACSEGNHGKRVAVSSTPGKTRHFQTHHLDSWTVICDCPGLVFPSFVSSKAEMVCNGVFPLSQLRDHVGPMSLIVQRIHRRTLEKQYGIKLPTPAEDEDPERQPTVKELLDTFSTARGFMAAAHAGPDHPRGARVILKDYVEGRLPFAHLPPGIHRKPLPTAVDGSRGASRQPLQVVPEADEGYILVDKERTSHASHAQQISDDRNPRGDTDYTGGTTEPASDEQFMMAAFGSSGGRSSNQPSKKDKYLSRKEAKRIRPRRKGDRDPDPYGTQKEEPTAQDFINKTIEKNKNASKKERGPLSAEQLLRSGRS